MARQFKKAQVCILYMQRHHQCSVRNKSGDFPTAAAGPTPMSYLEARELGEGRDGMLSDINKITSLKATDRIEMGPARVDRYHGD